MSYAIPFGTTSSQWIDNDPTPDGSVRYEGALPLNPIWDDLLGNIREKTPAELQSDADAQAIIDAEKAQDAIDRADFKARIQDFRDDMDGIVADQQVYIDTPATNNVGRDAHLLQLAKNLKQLARDFKQLSNVVKGLG